MIKIFTYLIALVLAAPALARAANEIKPGSAVRLAQPLSLYFYDQYDRSGERGETYKVAVHRPSEKRVYLLVKDAAGKDKAVWGYEWAVVPEAAPPDASVLLGLSDYGARKQPIPDVPEQTRAIIAASKKADGVLTDDREVQQIIMRGLNGASNSVAGRFFLALEYLAERLPREQRLKARLADQLLEPTRLMFRRLMYEGDLESFRKAHDYVLHTKEDPILPWTEITKVASVLSVEERVNQQKALRANGICLAWGLQYVPLSRKILADVIGDPLWAARHNEAVLKKVLHQEGGQAFARYWMSLGSFGRALDYNVGRSVAAEHLGFLTPSERSEFADNFTKVFTERRFKWFALSNDYIGGVEPELACDMAMLMTSRFYLSELSR